MRNVMIVAMVCLLISTIMALLSAAEPVQERVIDLPNLADGKFYLTIVVAGPPNGDDIALLEFMRSNKAMVNLRSQIVYNEWSDAKQIVKDTAWATFLGSARPAVLLQAPPDASGQADKVFFAAGKLDLQALPRQMQDAVDQYAAKEQLPCPPGRPCPYPVLPRVPLPRPAPHPPQPQPAPQPAPAPVSPPPVIQPLVPTILPTDAPAEDEGGIPLWALALPVLGGLGGGLWSAFRKG